MVNKLISSILIILFSITLVSAVEVYSGESYSFVLQEPYEYYSIVGNSSQVDLTVEFDGLNATITFGNYINDDFEIIFFNSEKEIITVYQSSGGGGTRTRYVDRNSTTYETLIEYEDKIVDNNLPGEIIIRNNVPLWVVVIISILILYIIYSLFKGDSNTATRRLEKNENEQKDSYADNVDPRD